MQNYISNSNTVTKITSDVLLHLNIPLASKRDFPQSIMTALKSIGELSGHDRINIIEIHTNMTYTILYEWYDKDLQPIPDKWNHRHILHDIPLEQQLCSQNYIIIHEADQDINPDIKMLLQGQNCRQMLLLPLFESNSQFAFITFMQCKDTHEWDPEEIKLLINLSSVIATQLNNYLLIKRLSQRLRQTQKQKEPTEILKIRLQHLYSEIIPAWERIRNSAFSQDIQEKIPEFTNMNEHISTLDKICRTIPVK